VKPTKKGGGRENAPYNFEPSFERGVVYLASTSPKFMARVAHELRPDLLGLPECQLALEAAQAIARERGRGPSHYAAVLQEVAAKREAGKIDQEQVRAVAGFFDTFDGQPLPNAEDFEAGALKVVKARLRFAIAQATVAEHGKDDWEQVKELQAREESLGKGEADIGIVATAEGAIEALRAFRALKRMPFGIAELDQGFGTGVPRGTLTCFMAAAGGAKSMTMSHITAQRSLTGDLVAYASLELPAELVIPRIIACQTGFTIDEVTDGSVDAQLAAALAAYPNRRPPVVQLFETSTTCAELDAWVKNIELREGRPIDVLVVDYADKLSATGKPDERGMYHEMRIVYEQLRGICDKRKIMGITASQSKSRDEKKAKIIDLEHTADSIHKARIVDQFITLNYDDTTGDMTFFLAKNRYGAGRKSLGPVPTNYACGQVAPVERAAPPVQPPPPPPTPLKQPDWVDGIDMSKVDPRVLSFTEDGELDFTRMLPLMAPQEPPPYVPPLKLVSSLSESELVLAAQKAARAALALGAAPEEAVEVFAEGLEEGPGSLNMADVLGAAMRLGCTPQEAYRKLTSERAPGEDG